MSASIFNTLQDLVLVFVLQRMRYSQCILPPTPFS